VTVGLAGADEVALGQRLHHVITQFCRGVDRRDAELVRDCFHPDAFDDHGVFKGGPSDLAEWLLEVTAAMQFMQHTVSNFHLFGVRDDVATTETYWHMRGVGVDGQLAEASGRYLDRFERRAGQWRIANRLCTLEWSSPGTGYGAADFAGGATDRGDPSYALADLVAPEGLHAGRVQVDGVVA